jgi:predicted DNA-binding protein (MmcQ/YjbR family)
METAMKDRRDNPLIAFCRDLPGVTEDVKWGKDLVFSVGGRMFAAFDLTDTRRFSFKTTADEFEVLIGLPGIRPAPYAARFHWVSVEGDGALTAPAAKSRLQQAQRLVSGCLPLRTQRQLGLLGAGPVGSDNDGGDSRSQRKRRGAQRHGPARSRRTMGKSRRLP